MSPSYITLGILITVLQQASAIRGIGRSCREDSQCRAYNDHLRCYSKPGLVEFVARRCQCQASWRYTGRECRPPPGWSPPSTAAPPAPDYVSVLTPALLLSAATLVISVCACYYVHSGNSELHRQLKTEYQAGARQSGNKYKSDDLRSADTPDIQVAVIDSENDEDDHHEASVEIEDPEVPSNLNVIEKVMEDKEQERPPSSTLSGSRLSVRSLEGRKSGLHPLAGLVQPTGLVPGYQANMRLLFRQRPASAVSLAAGLTSQHFVLKSRPASAVSRMSTTATAGLGSEVAEMETDLTRSQDLVSSLRPGHKVEASQEEHKDLTRYDQQSRRQSGNGYIKNGPVKNGLRKIDGKSETNDSDSNCSKSSVRFSSETINIKKPPSKRASPSSVSSKTKVLSAINTDNF